MNRLATLLAVAAAIALMVPSAAGQSMAPTFEGLSAEAPLSGPVVFRATISADQPIERAEVLVQFSGSETVTVLSATLDGDGGQFDAEGVLEGHVVPNTRIAYRFRVRYRSGEQFESSSAEIITIDDRFTWRVVAGAVVRVHWYAGDEAFARRALAIAEEAVTEAAGLLGVGEMAPMDLFLYSDEGPFRDALGPGTRENVGGEAHADIRTMYALISAGQIEDPTWRAVIAHELTHLVFDAATQNDYRRAAFWLNEGVAVYLSEGNSERWRGSLRLAVADGTVIPLQGLAATFAAGDYRFELGYAEAVSAVDYFVETYGEPKLWELVRSYADGLSDDEAFTRATGADLPAFNQAWMVSIGTTVPAEHGPQAGPTGPLPPDWQGLPPATPGPVVTPGPPRPTARPLPNDPNFPADDDLGPPGAVAVGIWLATVLTVLAAVWLVRRRNRRRPAQAWYWPPPSPAAPPTKGPPRPPSEPPLPPWPPSPPAGSPPAAPGSPTG